VRSVWLIALNFAHEQRWPLFFLLFWVVGWAAFGLVANPRTAAEDSLMIFRQLAVYAIAFAVFFGSSALSADQRSGRILLVLSKGISRLHYVFGLLAGLGMVLGVFCLCTAFTASWVLGRFASDPVALWMQMLALYTATLLAGSLTMLLATFLPPLFAAIGSGLLGGLLALFSFRRSGGSLVPLYALVQPVLESEIGAPIHPGLAPIVVGLVESVLLLLLASWIFTARDLPVVRE
jgi:hypothetical protein